MSWWRDAVIYQVYLRSFADGNDDGIGDLAGLRSRLPYLAGLGIDALWLTPWYVSPMADGGYDVADYRAIDPVYGTLDDADGFLHEAHDAGLRVIVDLVPNHCSIEHSWFRAAAAEPGAQERSLFHFRAGRGEDGGEPPNDWQSWFGGPAWTQLPDGEWYLHLFSPEQPDLNWESPEVHKEFRAILGFWTDRGVDGFRVDVAHALVKAKGLPDVSTCTRPPYEDQDGVHEIYRDWRRIVDAAPKPCALVGEVWPADSSNTPLYVRPDELHGAFNFDFLCCAWDFAAMHEVIEQTIERYAAVGAPSSWVLANHDVTRQVTRFGRADSGYDVSDRRHGWPTDRALGTRRARAAALLMLALPGTAYLYQGEELGLPEVEDLPDDALRDPMVARSQGKNRGRDGCRIPLPWDGEQPPYGFSSSDIAPWLPQPRDWATLAVAAQTHDASSTLALYRGALACRRELQGGLEWTPAPPGVLAFRRGSWQIWANLSTVSVALPEGAQVRMASGPQLQGELGPDTTVWFCD